MKGVFNKEAKKANNIVKISSFILIIAIFSFLPNITTNNDNNVEIKNNNTTSLKTEKNI